MYGIQVSRLSEAWKELENVRRRFYKKLKGVSICAANEFAGIILGRESRRGKNTVNYLVPDYVSLYRRFGKTSFRVEEGL